RRPLRAPAAEAAAATLSSPAIAVNDLHAVTALAQVIRQSLADGHRAVTASRTAEADGEIALHLLLILRQQIGDEVEQLGVEGLVFRLRAQISDNLRIGADLRPQLVDEVRVGKE